MSPLQFKSCVSYMRHPYHITLCHIDVLDQFTTLWEKMVLVECVKVDDGYYKFMKLVNVG